MGQSAKLMAFATPLTASAITISIENPNWRIAPSYSAFGHQLVKARRLLVRTGSGAPPPPQCGGTTHPHAVKPRPAEEDRSNTSRTTDGRSDWGLTHLRRAGLFRLMALSRLCRLSPLGCDP